MLTDIRLTSENVDRRVMSLNRGIYVINIRGQNGPVVGDLCGPVTNLVGNPVGHRLRPGDTPLELQLELYLAVTNTVRAVKIISQNWYN